MAHTAFVACLAIFEQAAGGHFLPHQFAFQRTETVTVELALLSDRFGDHIKWRRRDDRCESVKNRAEREREKKVCLAVDHHLYWRYTMYFIHILLDPICRSKFKRFTKRFESI